MKISKHGSYEAKRTHSRRSIEAARRTTRHVRSKLFRMMEIVSDIQNTINLHAFPIICTMTSNICAHAQIYVSCPGKRNETLPASANGVAALHLFNGLVNKKSCSARRVHKTLKTLGIDCVSLRAPRDRVNRADSPFFPSFSPLFSLLFFSFFLPFLFYRSRYRFSR